ncbi:H/ACA ribonucleoprotein complex subunit GAR1 [Thermogladius sp. 4427co]|uniref:H/ACA ribonucleoprotein complex subunit GAR1 n=1 Tax=Thermogladius sp. 4427co TaxID=3450718 RepID=UPI003F796C37
MKKLGIIEVIGREGFLVIKPSIGVREDLIGSRVYDSNLRRLGKIVDIIGRVEDPRIIVKLESKDLAATIRDYLVYYEHVRKERSKGR